MKITLNWLKDFVDFDLSAEELAEKYDMSGTAVEGIVYLGAGLENIVVGEVLKAEKHPDADRLKVCEVDIGTERATIVCGAPNVAAGQKVAVARPGAVLPNGLKIAAAKIRGVASAGMICSETELGLASESAGIMVLVGDPRAGEPVVSLLGLDDWMLELEITPNRPDCMSMIGMARETAALVGGRIRRPEFQLSEYEGRVDSKISVEINDPDLCPRYSARFVDNVVIGPSPTWMKRRLESIGVRSINNVVDVTNYVLMETGQPLHAFDYSLLKGGKIVVRRAKKGEKLETIDHVSRTLADDHLVIADGSRAVALAGVMGGLDSEIGDMTTQVLIESANFFAPNIRKSARGMGLISESSLRFERGVDIGGTVYAADRAAQLLAETAGGRVWSGVVDNYPAPRAPRVIDLRPGRVQTILGIEPDKQRFTEILENLELTVEDADENLRVSVPTFRVDLEREIDLMEEIARFYGLNNIKTGLLAGAGADRGLSPLQKFTRDLRELMVSAGLNEVINYSFIGQNELDKLGLPPSHPWATASRIANPLSEDQALMRTTLVSSLLRTIAHNCNRDQKDLAVFEIGNVFRTGGTVPEQTLKLAASFTGRRRGGDWHTPESAQADFFDIKGVCELICAKMNLSDCHVRPAEHAILAPGQCAELVAGADVAAVFGVLHPKITDNFELREPVFVLEADIARLFQQVDTARGFAEIPRVPPVILDLALIVDEETTWESVHRLVSQTGAPLLKNVRLFDLYRGPGVPEGKKSIAFNLTFQASDRTLTDDEIDHIQKRIVKRAERELNARLRD